MYNSDVEHIFELVPIGTPVNIVGSYGESSSGLRLGSTGPLVYEIQSRLILLGYLLGPADGVFGPATDYAVRRFQAGAGLVTDGVAGQATMRALGIT